MVTANTVQLCIFVNEEIDGGAIVLQAKVPIFPGDTVEEIELRTREQEYHILSFSD